MKLIVDCKTGKQSREPISESETASAVQGALNVHNEDIRAELAANDLSAIRALLDGDTARIEQHKKAQAELRAKLK